jgi:hypothetical protein
MVLTSTIRHVLWMRIVPLHELFRDMQEFTCLS